MQKNKAGRPYSQSFQQENITKVNEQMMMPINLKVHQATAGGFHISLFFAKLREELNRY